MTHRSSERGWEAEPEASFARRLGKSPKELTFINEQGGDDTLSKSNPGCMDIWELSNGDVAVIGRDLTKFYVGRLPEGVSIADDERNVIIPRVMMISAKEDIPDA
jgi:hypothetical protein